MKRDLNDSFWMAYFKYKVRHIKLFVIQVNLEFKYYNTHYLVDENIGREELRGGVDLRMTSPLSFATHTSDVILKGLVLLNEEREVLSVFLGINSSHFKSRVSTKVFHEQYLHVINDTLANGQVFLDISSELVGDSAE